MERRALLVQALYDAQAEVKLYAELLAKAQQSEGRIQAELNDSLRPANSGHTKGQVREVREGILRVLAQAKSMKTALVAPRHIIDELATLPTDLILRELHKLASDSRSDVCWNGRKGAASRYARV